ncbi:TetR/AcrR family transcriptional regulator [Algoriphagus sp. AGSA1]|uniref:TetR/AcrR family transcriptional regulator n=1 Tax=Algoriphagus sp. AGSA1 TaxID=2907213 RepID=UPI001F289168|nr:TetR/AcrR family transcriptional regulator [Algoriphagus sp. AGSA1]MCE7058004.1 TetR/AcrR family transcriptional regulator [Algoriphagus sp. AGSA1]
MEIPQEKKKLIIGSALDLINCHGFHGCPMSQVAKNAGVAAGTIYTYFENKEDMIYAIHDEVMEQIYEQVALKDDPSRPFEERFFTFWDNLLEFYEQNRAIQSFIDQFASSPFNSEDFQSKSKKWYSWTGEFFRSGIEQGAIKEMNPVILKILVNESANSLAKVKKNYANKLTKNQIDLSPIPFMIWDGIKAVK